MHFAELCPVRVPYSTNRSARNGELINNKKPVSSVSQGEPAAVDSFVVVLLINIFG